MEFDKLSNQIIGCAIEAHKNLGPGLLESTYEHCLAHELKRSNISFKLQRSLPVNYKEIKLDCCYRIDMLIENKIIVELKSVDSILPIHQAQLLTYLKLSGIRIGFLMNFNVKYMKNGIKRMVL